MDTDEEGENGESPDTLREIVPTLPKTREPLKSTQGKTVPQIQVTKTGKVQELVAQKGPKVPDPIRGMSDNSRFDIRKILDLPVEISVGELLDRSDTTIKELVYNM